VDFLLLFAIVHRPFDIRAFLLGEEIGRATEREDALKECLDGSRSSCRN